MEYSISALCRLFSVTPNAIRYYERIGLIHPAYSDGGRRIYSALDIAELMQVKTLQAIHLDLAEIGSHFHRVPAFPLNETRQLLNGRLNDINRQIVLLEESRRLLQGYIQRMAEINKPFWSTREMIFPAVRMLSLEPFWGRTKKQQQVLSEWISALPAVRMMDEYLVEGGRIISRKAGLCIRQEVFDKLQPVQTELSYSVPEAQVLSLNIQKPFDPHRRLEEEDLNTIIQEFQFKKLWQSMRIRSSFLFAFMQNDQPMSLIEVWVEERKE